MIVHYGQCVLGGWPGAPRPRDLPAGRRPTRVPTGRSAGCSSPYCGTSAPRCRRRGSTRCGRTRRSGPAHWPGWSPTGSWYRRRAGGTRWPARHPGWHRSANLLAVRLRRFLLLVAAATLALSTGASGVPDIHRAESQGQGGGGPIAVALAPSASPTPSSPPAPSAPANPYLAMVPMFDPAPVAQPIAVPPGPVAPIYHRLPVQQRVAFLTMDDGQVQLPEAIPLMQAAHIRFTMFLIAPVAAHNPSFFQQLVAAGGVIEDHTITHPELKGKSYAFQHHEVCEAKGSL